MGTLDQSTGTNVERKIKFIDVTSYSPSQLETAYNNNYGKKGWRVIQLAIVGNNRYIIAEKEV